MRSSAFEIFKKYFSSLNARNHEFCQAIWPLLSDWQSFSGKNQLFMQLERLAKKQSSDVHFACVKALKRYMNSRDFHHEARYSSTSYLGGLFSYTYATTAFAAWNKKLDDYLINLSSSEKSQNYGVSYKAMFINGLSSTITATQKIISKGLSTFASHPMTSACVIAVFFQMIRIKADPINGLYDPSLPPDEGGVFMVNSDAQSDYLYSDSCTATLADNSVIAVFNGKVNEPHHGFGLYAQRLYFDGVKRNNTLVNDAVYTQISPAVIRLKDNYLISWLHKPVQAYAGKILAQRFDLNNNQLGNPVRLVKISTPSGTPPSGTNIPTARTDLGVLPNGGYVLTFENADADTVGVYIRMFSAESAPVTKAIRVNTLTSGLQTFHSSKQPLAILPNGEFVVTWSSYSHQGNKAIYLQRFSKTGHRIGNNTQVNDRIHTIDIPFVHTGFSAAAASFADGHVLITWSSREDTTAPIRVNGQLYDLDNRAVGGNFLITPDFVHAYAPTMATFADNSVVLAYYAAYLNASNIPTMVYTQKLRLNHTTRGITMDQPFLVSSTDLANMQNKTYVIPLNPDNYFVTWHRREVVSGDGNVFGRLLMSPQFKQYSTIPVVQGVPIRLNTTYLEATTFDEANPHYLSYSVTGLEHAYINSITGEPTTYFTQQTVNQNQITLVPDGSKHPPRLNLTIHHGRLKKPDQGVFIDFTRQPPILTRAAWQVISRTFVPITLANINASDLGYPHDALWVNVTEQSDGAYFCDPHNIQRYRAFQLQQIKRGQIYFFADRPPSVSLIVSDAYTVNSQPIKANITYYPGLSLSCSFILKQGQWLSLTNTVVDAEEEGFSYKKFSFIANFQHAQLKVGQRIFNASQSDILFSGEDILNGRVAFFSNTDINKLPMLTLTVTGASLQTLTRDCSVNYFVPPVLKQRYHFELNPRRAASGEEVSCLKRFDLDAIFGTPGNIDVSQLLVHATEVTHGRVEVQGSKHPQNTFSWQDFLNNCAAGISSVVFVSTDNQKPTAYFTFNNTEFLSQPISINFDFISYKVSSSAPDDDSWKYKIVVPVGTAVFGFILFLLKLRLSRKLGAVPNSEQASEAEKRYNENTVAPFFKEIKREIEFTALKDLITVNLGCDNYDKYFFALRNLIVLLKQNLEQQKITKYNLSDTMQNDFSDNVLITLAITNEIKRQFNITNPRCGSLSWCRRRLFRDFEPRELEEKAEAIARNVTTTLACSDAPQRLFSPQDDQQGEWKINSIQVPAGESDGDAETQYDKLSVPLLSNS